MKSLFMKSCFIAFCIFSASLSEGTADSFASIDAFTTASIYHTCTLFTSKIYKDRAELQWWEYWNIDNKLRVYKLQWGTEEGVYTDSFNLFDSLAACEGCAETKTIVLDNLQPGVKYYAEIYRDWNGDLSNQPFVFTTPPLDPIPPVPEDDLGYIGYQILAPTHVTFPKKGLSAASSKEISSVKVTTISGREASRFPYVSLKNTKSTITGSKLVPGLYIATLLNKKGSAVSSIRFLIN